MADLILRAPSPPDFTLCDAFYNTSSPINLADCIIAGRQIPSGNEPIHYDFARNVETHLDVEYPVVYPHRRYQDTLNGSSYQAIQ